MRVSHFGGHGLCRSEYLFLACFSMKMSLPAGHDNPAPCQTRSRRLPLALCGGDLDDGVWPFQKIAKSQGPACNDNLSGHNASVERQWLRVSMNSRVVLQVENCRWALRTDWLRKYQGRAVRVGQGWVFSCNLTFVHTTRREGANLRVAGPSPCL